MGNLNLVISNDLDEKFRMEVAKRLGMKKGNLTVALEQAIELWIENDVIKELEIAATSKSNTPITHDKAIDALGKMGSVALPTLTRIANHPNSTVISKDKALGLVDEILKSQK